MDNSSTIKKAFEMMKMAYVPYSLCHVGAAIMLKNREIIGGCNVENASYGLSNCAERTAMFNMISLGYKKEDVDHMVIVSDFKGNTRPCGACRQVMVELLPFDCKVYMLNVDGSFYESTVSNLLPESFTEKDLK